MDVDDFTSESRSEFHKEFLVPALGDVIANRYEVIRVLGSGGMARVHLVKDLALLGEEVALKLLHFRTETDAPLLARFRNEVMLARKLSHPHITRLHDFGATNQDIYYITMEFVEGMDVAAVVEQYPSLRMPVSLAANILFQTAVALDHAHRHGIVHRDVKPGNILLQPNGLIKLTDFGVARSLTAERHITASGELVGTVGYMAPELLRGEKPDPRVDIYALGIVAYEMVVGDLPFYDPTLLVSIARQLNTDLPLMSSKVPSVPNWYQEFVDICTEKDPKHRYQTASELLHDLWNRLRVAGITPTVACYPPDLVRAQEERSREEKKGRNLLARFLPS